MSYNALGPKFLLRLGGQLGNDFSHGSIIEIAATGNWTSDLSRVRDEIITAIQLDAESINGDVNKKYDCTLSYGGMLSTHSRENN